MKKSPAGLSPWKIPVLISNSGVDISPFVCVRCNDVFQFFIVDSMKFIIVASNLCIFKMSIIQSWGTESPFCNRSTLLKSFLFLASSWMILLMRSWLMVPNVLAEFSVFFLFRRDSVCLNVMGYLRGDHASVDILDYRKACYSAVV